MKLPNHNFWTVKTLDSSALHPNQLLVRIALTRDWEGEDLEDDGETEDIFHWFRMNRIHTVPLTEILSSPSIREFVRKTFRLHNFQHWPLGKDGTYNFVNQMYFEDVFPPDFQMSDEDYNTLHEWLPERILSEIERKIQDIVASNPIEVRSKQIVARKAKKQKVIRQRKANSKRVAAKRKDQRKVKYGNS